MKVSNQNLFPKSFSMLEKYQVKDSSKIYGGDTCHCDYSLVLDASRAMKVMTDGYPDDE